MEQSTVFQRLVPFITAVHQVQHEISKDMPIGEITPVQYSILEYLAVEQPVTLSHISDCIDISMPNASRELKKLTDKGLIVKYDDAHDRRKQYVRLSPVGEELMNNAFAHLEVQMLRRLGDISDEQIEQILKAMDVLQSTIFRPSSS